jgi:hypothetical protein
MAPFYSAKKTLKRKYSGKLYHALGVSYFRRAPECETETVHLYAGMESECFGEKATSENLEGKPFLQVYKSVLNSKATEDSLVSFLY